MKESEPNSGVNNEPEKYNTPDQIQKWVDRYTVQQDRDDLDTEEWKTLQEEFKKLSKENPEYQLAYLRHIYPSEPTDDMLHIEQQLLKKRRREREQAEAEQAEKTPVNPENNILNHYQETLDRMAQIEGESWKNLQESYDENKENSLKAALKFVREHGKKSHHNIQVYGNGGANRWKVQTDGSVEFHSHNAIHVDGEMPDKKRAITKVRLLGFGIC